MKKRLSQVISLTVIVAMLLSMAGATVLAKNSHTVGTTAGSLVPAAEVLFSENFNAITNGTAVAVNDTFGNASYTQLYVPTANGVVKVVGDGTDNYLSVSASSDGATKGAFRLRASDANVFTGKYTTEFKFMLPYDKAEADCTIFCNMGGIGLTAKEYYGARVKYYGDNKFQVFDGTTGSNVADNKILQGVWYNVKVVTDITNDKWTLYLNGNPLFRDKKLHSKSGTDNMLTPFYGANFKGTIYYDDIVMYREPVGRTTYSAEDFAGYGAGRDWSTFENTAFVGGNYLPTSYKANAVDAYDTWLQGMNLAPAKLFTNGKIANGKMQLGGTGKQSVVLLNEYSNNHYISQDMAVSFTFNTTNAATNHDEIYRMRENAGKTGGIRLQLNQRNLIADSNPSVILMSGIKDNTDYRITVVSDFSAKTYSVYVDGVCIGTGLAHKVYTGTDTYSNNGRPLEITLAATAPTCYYDDLVIYTDAREDVMATAMAAAKANAAVVKEGEASFALPASATAGYTVSWSSDNAAIAVADGTANVTYPEAATKVTLTATVADANNEYAIERKLVVNVPSKYDTEVSAKDGVVTGTVTVNDLAGEGYNGGTAILAIYDSSDRVVDVKYIGAVNGTATVTSDKITEAGNYTAKLFFLNLSNVKPFTKRIQPYSFEVK